MRRRVLLMTVLGSLAWIGAANASPIGLMSLLADNPIGRLSFATIIESYDPVFLSGTPTGAWRNSKNALGAPDYLPERNYASLGVGGTLVLGFARGALTGSGNSAPDLLITEVGPDVEDTFGWVSSNGTDWVSLGRIAGGTTAVDLDALGFDASDSFSFLMLMDDPGQGLRHGPTVGADIDSVAVVNSAPTPMPEPAALILLATGLLGLAVRRRWNAGRA